MDINVQAYQVVTLIGYLTLGVIFWKVKSKYVRVALVLIAAGLFFVNPIRHKQGGVVLLEGRVSKFENIPDKTIVKGKDFQLNQELEMQKLKTYSKGIEDEMHD